MGIIANLISEKIAASVKETAMKAGVATIATVAASISSVAESINDNAKDRRRMKDNRIGVPQGYAQCIGQYYMDIVKQFRAYGFSDIRQLEQRRPLFKKGGAVCDVAINGERDFKSGDRFKKDAIITIVYFSE